MPVLVLALCAAAYGAVAGCLLPRAVYRLALPPGERWRTECAEGHRLSGLLGRTGCPACAAPAGSLAYAAACGLLCAALAAATGPRPELAVWLAAVPVGVLLAAVDATSQRLPDVLTLPFAAATAALLGGAQLLPRAHGTWTGALLGGAALAAGYFVLFLINPRGMGFGDVKLAASQGLALGWYGWNVLFAATFAAFLLAAGYGLALLLARRARWKSSVPFGPFMLLGTFLGLILGGLSA